MTHPLCIIPAREHSRRIAQKNLRPLGGVSPLRRALQVCQIVMGAAEGQIVVTGDWFHSGTAGHTDGRDICWHRAEAPLHTDTCSMVDVVLDVLQAYPAAEDQKVLLVQPTQPLRHAQHLRDALECLDDSSSLATVTETESLDKLYLLSPEARLVPAGTGCERHQDSRRTYRCDGTVYGFRRGWFLVHRSFRHPHDTLAVPLAAEETCALDTPTDWAIAESRLQNWTPC